MFIIVLANLHFVAFLPISYYQLFVPISVYSKQLNCLDDGGIQGKAKTKVCPADVPCMYELKNDARHAEKGPMMMCGSRKIPGVAMDKTICHTSKDGSHIRCYCMADDCNQNCTLPKDTKCTDLGSVCTGSIPIGSRVMAVSAWQEPQMIKTTQLP